MTYLFQKKVNKTILEPEPDFILPHKVSLNNIEILKIIFFQILEVETFIQFRLSCALMHYNVNL